MIPGASSELLAERIADAKLTVIPGTGHLFFLEQPEQTVAILEDFLKEPSDA